MDFKENVTSILQAGLTLGYAYMEFNDATSVYFYQHNPTVIRPEAEVPLVLTFTERFVVQWKLLCKDLKSPFSIRTVLENTCAKEWQAFKAAEAMRSDRAVSIRHKPNQLTAVRSQSVQYLLTLNGVVRTNPGDWIIRGVNGEEYPCDPEIFKKLYDII